MKKFSISRGRDYDPPPRVSRFTVQNGSELAKFDEVIKTSTKELESLREQTRASESDLSEKQKKLTELDNQIFQKTKQLDSLDAKVSAAEQVEEEIKEQLGLQVLQLREKKVYYPNSDMEKYGIGPMFRTLHGILFNSPLEGVLNKFVKIPLEKLEFLRQRFTVLQDIVSKQTSYIFDLETQVQRLKRENSWLKHKEFDEELRWVDEVDLREVSAERSLSDMITLAQQEVQKNYQAPKKETGSEIDL